MNRKRKVNSKESDKLEEETKAIELRLKSLKLSLEEQKKKSAIPKSGIKWGTSKAERGSIRSYAKDVKEKINTKPTKVKRPQSGRRELIAENSQLTPEIVKDWNIAQVSLWLSKTLGLTEYCKRFEKNQIDGCLLLELSDQDMDYMKIDILGHRKTILKAIETIKKPPPPIDADSTPPLSNLIRKKTPIIDPTKASPLLDTNPTAISSTTTAVDTEAVPPHRNSETTKPSEGKRVHWSQVKPLSANQISGNGRVPVNLGDADDVYDEAKEHASFIEAVNEWRKSIKEKPKSLASAGGSDVWMNPLGGPETDTSELLLLSDNNNEEKIDREKIKNAFVTSVGNESKLAEGEYDENEQRRLFQQAVKDWRASRAKGNNNSSNELKETTTIITGTNEEPLVNDKICCWKCYKIFSMSKVYTTIEKEKNFCSENCFNLYIEENTIKCHNPKCENKFYRPKGICKNGLSFCCDKCSEEPIIPVVSPIISSSNDYNEINIDSKMEEEFKLDNYNHEEEEEEKQETKKTKPSPIQKTPVAPPRTAKSKNTPPPRKNIKSINKLTSKNENNKKNKTKTKSSNINEAKSNEKIEERKDEPIISPQPSPVINKDEVNKGRDYDLWNVDFLY